MELRLTHVLVAVALGVTALLVLLAVAVKLMGWAFVGMSMVVLVVGALAIGSGVAWPIAYAIIAIAYWAREDPVSTSTEYSLDQGRSAGEGDDMRGESRTPPSAPTAPGQ